jgi:hypothetical protein
MKLPIYFFFSFFFVNHVNYVNNDKNKNLFKINISKWLKMIFYANEQALVKSNGKYLKKIIINFKIIIAFFFGLRK